MATDYTLASEIVTNQLTVPGNNSVVRGGIEFIGRGTPSYEENRNTTLLQLVENFASEEDPGNPGFPLVSVIDNPFIGQKWFNITTNTLLVYNGTSWISSVEDDFIIDGTYSVSDITNEVDLDMQLGGLPVVGAITLTNIATPGNLNTHFTGTNAHAADDIALTSAIVAGVNVLAGVSTLNSLLNGHIADTTAHASSAVSYSPFVIVSTNVQDALEELEDDIDALQATLTTATNTFNTHISTGGHQASAIFHDPIGPGPNTNVQVAIDNLDAALDSATGLKVLDWIRATNTSVTSQVIGSVGFVTLPIDTKEGDSLNQLNIGTRTYTAAFDQEVEIRGYCDITVGCQIEIRVNGTDIARNRADPQYGLGLPGPLNQRREGAEVVTRTRLNVGDTVQVLYTPNVAGSTSYLLPSEMAVEYIVYRQLP